MMLPKPTRSAVLLASCLACTLLCLRAAQAQTPAAKFSVMPLGNTVMAAATGDMGANVNAAFASQGGSAGRPVDSVLVQLPAGGVFAFATPIVIPHEASAPFIRRPTLDCQGSVLHFTGAGDAVTVLEQNGGNSTGSIINCVLEKAPGNRAAVNGVHQFSRIWFSYRNDQFTDWNNPGSSALLIDNSRTAWGGYNERTHVTGVGFQTNLYGIRFHISGGTNSFARTVVEAEFMLVPGGSAIFADNGAYIYGSTFEVHANGIANNDHVVTLTNKSVLASPTSLLEGENVACGVSLDATSILQVSTDASGPLCNAGTSDHYLVGQQTFGFTYQARPYGIANQEQMNNAKFSWTGSSLKLGIPYNGYPQRTSWGSFQVYSRTTSPAQPLRPEVDYAGDPDPVFQPTNVLFAAATGVGLGPGFADGKAQPKHTLDVAGDMLWSRAVALPAGTDLNTITRCGIYEATTPAHAPEGANRTLRVQVMCAASARDAAQNAVQTAVNAADLSSGTWTRTGVSGNWSPWVQVYPTQGFSGTVKEGSCTLVIAHGLVTAVNGCAASR